MKIIWEKEINKKSIFRNLRSKFNNPTTARRKREFWRSMKQYKEKKKIMKNINDSCEKKTFSPDFKIIF